MTLFRRLFPLLLVISTACTNEVRTLRGDLQEGEFALQGAQVIALPKDGAPFRARVADDGRFSIALPTDRVYSLRFANSTSQAGVFDAFAVLINRDRTGAAYKYFSLSKGGSIELGRVSAVTVQSSALRIADAGDEDEDADSEGEDDADSDSESSTETEAIEGDVEQACDLASGSDMTAVEPENSVLEETDADGDGSPDAEDASENMESCSDVDSDSDGDSDSDSDSDSDEAEDETMTSSTSDDADSDSEDGDSDSDNDSDSDSDADSETDDCDDAEETGDEACETETGTPPVDGTGNAGEL